MLTLPPSVRVLMACELANMRKGFDGLAHLVQSVLQEDPLSGHLFVLRNRRGDRIKLLLWDSDGFLILYKRQESNCTRPRSFTGSRGHTHNLASQPVAAGGMGSDQGSSLARR
jgi:transposase